MAQVTMKYGSMNNIGMNYLHKNFTYIPAVAVRTLVGFSGALEFLTGVCLGMACGLKARVG